MGHQIVKQRETENVTNCPHIQQPGNVLKRTLHVEMVDSCFVLFRGGSRKFKLVARHSAKKIPSAISSIRWLTGERLILFLLVFFLSFFVSFHLAECAINSRSFIGPPSWIETSQSSALQASCITLYI